MSSAGSNGRAAAGIRSVCVQRAVIVGCVRVRLCARVWRLPVGGTREEEEEARTLQAYLACVLCTGLRFSNKDKVPIPIFSFLFLVLFLDTRQRFRFLVFPSHVRLTHTLYCHTSSC
jgi:hypothetical protein